MPFDVASVRPRLPGREIEWFQSVSSTMTIAARLARDGCASGTIVGADGQVAGIGRQGHAWHSEACAGLYVSIVLRLPLAARDLPLVIWYNLDGFLQGAGKLLILRPDGDVVSVLCRDFGLRLVRWQNPFALAPIVKLFDRFAPLLIGHTRVIV